MSAQDPDLEERIAQELKKHTDPDYSFGKWFCPCGDRLRWGYTEMPEHREAVERKMREEAARG